MVATCAKGNIIGDRDKAIMLDLIDTEARSQEFLYINLVDINLFSGEILIRKRNGRKPRFVYIGSKTRKAVRNFLKLRPDTSPVLQITNKSEGFTYDG